MPERAAETARPAADDRRRRRDTQPERPGPVAAASGPPAVRLPRQRGSPPPNAPAPLAQAIRAPGRGQPLAPQVRGPIARSLGVDLEAVRVHTDPTAAGATGAIGARAFAYGTDVFLAPGERPTDLPLIAHEVAHVVQQQGRPSVQPYTTGGDAHEREANRTATAVQQGETAQVSGRTGGPQVQGQFGDWVEDKIWGLLEKYAPVLVPIIRQGFWNWLTEKISAAVESMLDTLMKPVRAVTGIVESLSAHFTNLVQWVREAAGKIARGDCSSITEAAQKIQDVFEGLTAPIIDKVKEWAEKVKGFFVGIWDKVGAPIWDFLKQVGGAIWDTIKDIASWIWEKTKPVRDWLSRAWKWIKDKLGIGEGPEGQNGILQWVQEKAGKAWDWVKAKLEPYKKQILIVAGVIIAITAGPMIAVAAAVGGLIYGIRWISQHLKTRGSVLDQRSVLEREVIPRILGAVNGVTTALGKAAAFLTEKFGSIVGGLGALAGQLAGSIISFLVDGVNWLIGKFKALLQWATEKVQGIADWIKTGLEKLKTFLEPVFEFIKWVGSVIVDIWNLVSGIVKRIWAKIPACIKDPVIDFLINQILKRIPIFSKLLQIKNIWDKVKDAGMGVIRAIFVQWDLKAAVYKFFDLILIILDIPKSLIQSIYTKARTAWDEITKDPLGFLTNILKALFQGFSQFFDNILDHLWNGAIKWFTGVLGSAGITVPAAPWTFGTVLSLILQIAGITVDKIFKILEKKIGVDKTNTLRKVYKTLTGAWEWVVVALDKGPAGLWEKVKEHVSDLWNVLIDALVSWATMQIIKRASPRLLAALNPIGAIINAILTAWAAIQTAGQYIKNVLMIVDTILDTAIEVARGVIAKAANFVEKGLAAAIPIAIGFLVNFLGLGDIADRISEMVEKVQKKVEEGLEKMIDKAIQLGQAILDRLGLGGPDKDDITFEEEGGAATHHLLVEGEGPGEELMVQSAKLKASEQLDFWDGKVAAKEVPASEDIDKVKAKLKTARGALTSAQLKSLPAKSGGRLEYMKKVADAFKKIYPIFGHHTVPPTVLKYTAIASSSAGASALKGHSAIAEPLTKTPASGYSPSSSTSDPIPAEQTGVFQKLTKSTNNWVKMHLIHFDLHGPDNAINFAPGTKAANTSGMAPIEHAAIEQLRKDNEQVLWYDVKASYWGEASRSDFPEVVVMSWGPWKPNATGTGGTRQAASGSGTIRVSPPTLDRGRAYLSTDGATVMNDISGLPLNVCNAVVDGRNELRDSGKLAGGQFSSVQQVLDGIKAARPRFDLADAQAEISKRMGDGSLRLNP